MHSSTHRRFWNNENECLDIGRNISVSSTQHVEFNAVAHHMVCKSQDQVAWYSNFK